MLAAYTAPDPPEEDNEAPAGGLLNGALLRAGLVDEVSLIITPCLVGGTTPRSIFVAPDLVSSAGVISLKLTQVEAVRGDAVWLQYKVVK